MSLYLFIFDAGSSISWTMAAKPKVPQQLQVSEEEGCYSRQPDHSKRGEWMF
jgi:hypothetical protein